MKKVLILGAGEMQVPIIKKSKGLGIYTYVVDYDKDAPGFKYADEHAIISTLDYIGILNYASSNQVDGVLTTSDMPVRVVSKVSTSLNLPGAFSEELANLCTDKYGEREFLRLHGYNVPKYVIVSNPNQLDEIDFFPCVIKPVDSSASRGVKKINNSQELKNEYPISVSFSNQRKVIVEEFIDGREFSVETLTQNNCTNIIQITEKLCIGEKDGFFVEDTHIEPARLKEKEKECVNKVVSSVLKDMHFNNCPSHTELKVNEKGVYIIEIACRLGGDYITSDLVPLSTGIDMLENLIKLAIGEHIDVIPKWNKYSVVQFINQTNYQRCIDFINKHTTDIHRYEIRERHNRPIQDSLDRMGYIILQNDNKESLFNLLQQIK